MWFDEIWAKSIIIIIQLNLNRNFFLYFPKLYNVVKYRKELSSAGKIYQNNKLVSSAVIWSENANESTQIYNEKYIIIQVCYFFSTQPFTNYFTLQRYIALLIYIKQNTWMITHFLCHWFKFLTNFSFLPNHQVTKLPILHFKVK